MKHTIDSAPAVPSLFLSHRQRTHPPVANQAIVREHLGTWELPSGGEMSLYLEDRGGPVCEWPQLPLSEANHRHYLRVIVPGMAERIKGRLGLAGNGLWVLL